MTQKNNLHQLYIPQAMLGQVPTDRCVGKTQAQAFLLIAKAMQNPGSKLMIIDHAAHSKNNAQLVNKQLRERIMEIIARTGMQFFECGQEGNGSLWLRFNLYSE